MNTITGRRVKYARGYAGLGLFREAEAELQAIAPVDAEHPEVLAAWLDVNWEAKRWEETAAAGRALATRVPAEERGWIGWAFALRELGRVAEAKTVLLRAEPVHGAASAVLHYNLGCYHCLLGELPQARGRLARAFRMHPPFKEDALHDPDLATLWDELRG